MNQYQNIIGRIHYCLGLAVVALLPFPQTLCLRTMGRQLVFGRTMAEEFKSQISDCQQ